MRNIVLRVSSILKIKIKHLMNFDIENGFEPFKMFT